MVAKIGVWLDRQKPGIIVEEIEKGQYLAKSKKWTWSKHFKTLSPILGRL